MTENQQYVNIKEKNALYKFSKALKIALKDLLSLNTEREIIILCIGTDKATGDSLGPLVGYKLNKLPKKENVKIYGTLEKPVHAINLKETVSHIYSTAKNPLIIAIDASLGKSEHIGYITIGKGSLRPGSGVKKDLGEVGDICITGIVNLSGFLQLAVLQTTRLSLVMNIADIITKGIWISL